MIKKYEMLKDIKEMLIVISGFTERNTEGNKILQEWIKKYDFEMYNATHKRS